VTQTVTPRQRMPDPSRAGDGLWAPQRRALTIGLVLTVTFVAAEALAVVTVLPVVARDLGGVRLYGWVFSAFMLGNIVGIVAAGRAADRRGPAVPFIAGLVLFGTGLVIAGLAPSMLVLVGGRLCQGVGAGAVPAVAYVAIGRCLPERLRARMMAVLSTAWVVPGLAGPALSAEVAGLFGWRWVFLGLLPLVAVTGSLAVPSLVRIGRPGRARAAAEGEQEETADGELEQAVGGGEHSVADGVGAAVGAGLFLAGLTLAAGSRDDLTRLAGGVLLLAGCGLGLFVLRRLLPAGTLRARRGLPATILSRGLLTFTFFGADAYVTLTITTIRHHTPALAGLAVTGATLAWTAGAWVQARLNDVWPGRRLVRLGLAVVLAGLAAMAAAVHSSVPVAVAIIAWTVAGFGMGLSIAPLSLIMLAEAPAGREGWASASLNLADVLGTALGIGIGGAAVTASQALGWQLSAGVSIAFAIAGLTGLLGLAVSRRLQAGAKGVSKDRAQALRSHQG
jgi:MFS family permease